MKTIESPPTPVTQLLARWAEGDPGAADRALPVVYPRLRRLAGSLLRGERPDHTLQPTALVHEAWLELSAIEGLSFEHRGRFFALAGRVMRRSLIDHARRRRAEKRGGGQAPVSWSQELTTRDPRPEAMLALDEALADLERIDARKARVVELRFFVGLTVDETADALGLSPRSVAREWRVARAMLRRLLLPGGA